MTADPREGDPTKSALEFRVEPAVSFFGLSGDLTLPGETVQGSEIDTVDLNLEDPRLEPYGEIQIRRGKVGLLLSGVTFSTRRTTGLFPGQGASTLVANLGSAPVYSGETVETEFSFQSFDFRVLYELYRYEGALGERGVRTFSFALEATGGIKLHRIAVDGRVLTATSPARTGGESLSTSVDEVFAEPVIGLRAEAEIYERLIAELEFVIGGFAAADDSSRSVDLNFAIGYRVTDWAEVIAGYRLLAFGFNAGDGPDEFEYAGALAGLYWGARFRF